MKLRDIIFMCILAGICCSGLAISWGIQNPKEVDETKENIHMFLETLIDDYEHERKQQERKSQEEGQMEINPGN